MTAGALGERLGWRDKAAWAVVGCLRRKHLIEAFPPDKRPFVWRLTEAGKTALAEIAEAE
jgi:hypothetical protein